MKQKTALITGASHGIGKAIAARFASEGCDLILNCKTDYERLQQSARELSDAYGIRTTVIPCDVSDHAAVCDMFAQIRSTIVIATPGSIFSSIMQAFPGSVSSQIYPSMTGTA